MTDPVRAGHRVDRPRAARLAVLTVKAVVVLVGLAVVPPWVSVFVPARVFRQCAIGLLGGLQLVYLSVVATAVVATIVLARHLARMGQRRRASDLSARLLLLSVATIGSAMVAEASALARRVWEERGPRLASPVKEVQLADPGTVRSDPKRLRLVVLGESSASGVPYQDRLSIGTIVGWKLGEVLAGRAVDVEVLARSGATLETMHEALAGLTYRPDVLIVYCGHNEFSARFSWSAGGGSYYEDANGPGLWDTLASLPRRVSAVCDLMGQVADRLRIEAVPPPWVTRHLVDVPVYSPEEYAERLRDYRTRLEDMAAHGRAVGAVTVLLVPPANDAGFEPSRSMLAPSTRRAERARVEAECRRARALEATDPTLARAIYHSLTERHPGFAEAHFRLARLMERDGEWAAAYDHYVIARDHDGLPMRCPSDFQQVCRDVAAAQGAALVDGQAVLRTEGARGLLDDSLFNDGMHPSLRGHVALARAVLDRLRADPRLGWPPSSPAPAVDAASCVDHFGLTPPEWCKVGRLTSAIWQKLAYARFDPDERLEWVRRYDEAVRRIGLGATPGAVGIPGFELVPERADRR